jgi:hypothetical protein
MFMLDQVIPWGRSFDEYRRMFAFEDADLGSQILGCADGPASFNAEATRRGAFVVSCDPIYRLLPDDIRSGAPLRSTTWRRARIGTRSGAESCRSRRARADSWKLVGARRRAQDFRAHPRGS